MPVIETPDGQLVSIPGVYDVIRVVSSLPGPLPAFQIPVILGQCWEGHPYNADSLKEDSEPDFTPFKLIRTDGAAATYFGRESPMHRALKFAKRHGLPFAYAVCLSALTRASVIATSTGPINQVEIRPRTFGAPGGWTNIAFDSTTEILTVTPVKRYAMLSANAGNTATRLYVEGNHGWLTVGAAVVIGSNAVAGVSKTITRVGSERTSTGQIRYFIEINSTVGSALDTSAYALVLQYDETKAETFTGITTAQALIDAINGSDGVAGSKYIIATAHADFTGVKPITQARKPIIEAATWASATDGASPAPTDSDLDDFITAMNAGEWKKFVLREKLVPQAYCLVSSDSSQHQALRDYATTERQRGYPISVTAGVAWGDTAIGAGNDTDPKFRAAALNSQDFCLCAGGLDYEAAFLSLAPAVWARRIEGGPGHNLTNDRLICSAFEVEWDEINSGEETSLERAGVVTYKLSIGSDFIGYTIMQGLSTLQSNMGPVWNEEDATTAFLMQRDLADFVSRVIKTEFESKLIGADEVDPNAVSAVLIRRAEKSLKKRGYIKTFKINTVELNSAGSGYDVDWSVTLKTTNDYMTVVTNILVGVE